MDKKVFHLNSQAVRSNASQAVFGAPEGYRVVISPRNRTLDQNDLLWSCLTDLSKQVKWPLNGKEETLSPEDWKDIMTASMSQENRIAQGVRGGFVMLGQKTSRMSVKKMTDLINFIHAFGTEQGVNWSPTSIGRE